MAYNIRPHSAFERSFSKLPRELKERAVEKIEFLAQHPEAIGAPMGNLPPDLRGLHKVRIGGWRLFFWVDHGQREIIPYGIDKRDKAYPKLWKR